MTIPKINSLYPEDNIFKFIFLNGHIFIEELKAKAREHVFLEELRGNGTDDYEITTFDRMKLKHQVTKTLFHGYKPYSDFISMHNDIDQDFLDTMNRQIDKLEGIYNKSVECYDFDSNPITLDDQTILEYLYDFINFRPMVYDYKYKAKHSKDNEISLTSNGVHYSISFTEIEIPYQGDSVIEDIINGSFNATTTTGIKIDISISLDNDSDPTTYTYLLNNTISFSTMKSFLLFKQTTDIIYRETINAFYGIMKQAALRYDVFILDSIDFNKWFKEEYYVNI